MRELNKVSKRLYNNPLDYRPTVERKAVIRIDAYPTLKEKNPELIRTGACVCGRKFTEHTRACITTYLDTRDPICGCDLCHLVNK